MTEILQHLATGDTTVCRCWVVYRKDGKILGFTDHDSDLVFEGIRFRADSGLTAHALQQSTGLSVDNSEALGALRGESLTEADIEAGRFDGARVVSWLVNWSDPGARSKRFEGTIGEVRRGAGAFRAELRGLGEALNTPQGLAYQNPCSAVLGDSRCRVDMTSPDYSAEANVVEVTRSRVLTFFDLPEFADRWLERGRATFLTGAAEGLTGVIKFDRRAADARRIELWQAIQAPIAPGDRVRLEAGCDKRPKTCKTKFSNFINYRGFPAIPGEDWLMAYPSGRTRNDGGRL